MDLVKRLLSACIRAVLSLRYRVEIRGLDEVHKKAVKNKGMLILPNHTAHIDPPLLLSWLWPLFRMRPLVSEPIARLPLFHKILPWLRGVSIPDFETSINQLKLKRAEKALQIVSDGLQNGDRFIVYPSGKFKNHGKEIIGGASGVHQLIEKNPDVQIVTVRVTGFWGSSFSKALTGRSPLLFSKLIEGFKILLKNFIFFTPRRKITLELALAPPEVPRHSSRAVFNRALEHWYNQYRDNEGKVHESEPLYLVPYQFWSSKVPTLNVSATDHLNETPPVSHEEREKILGEIRKIIRDPKREIANEMYLGADLGMDSLDVAELSVYLVQNHDALDLRPEDLDTVQNVLDIASRGSSKATSETPPHLFHWPKEPLRPDPSPPEGKTMPAAFLNICKKMGSFAGMGDDTAGVLTFKKCRTSVLVLAAYFRKYPEERIAVMLPSSVGAILVILALQFAGKIPVMLNWTIGPRYLENMMRIAEAKRVLTSWRFMEKLNHVDFGSLADQIEFLEDIKLALPLSMKLKGALLSFCPTSFIAKEFHLDRLAENRYAVILFSSGTESVPKGIPLSHKNILAAIRTSLGNYRDVLTAKDVMYGFLPCFHSFGFTISGFLPFLSGFRIAFFPNPMDNPGIAEGVKRWEITYFPTTPSFLKRLFQSVSEESLKGIRFFITAGSKAPRELFEKVKKINPQAQLTEGYGLTETAPTLTLMRPHLAPKGVGQLLPGIEAITIHHETKEPLTQGTQGEVCVRGPNVFQGYLGGSPVPFIEIDGKIWFRTGDIGYFDEDKTLILTGRMKRFVKLGGEMISLGAIEEAIFASCSKLHLITTDLPSIAVCPIEKGGEEPKLILFATFPIEREMLNRFLRESGFGNLVKISLVRQVKEIPMIGTGKIDYRNLQEMAETRA